MKQKNLHLIFLLQVVCFITACNKTAPINYIIGNVEYIESFPIDTCLQPTITLIDNISGIANIKGIDSLMLTINTDNEYYMSIFSTRSGKKLMDILKKGNRPSEFLYPPSLQRLTNINDSLLASLLYNTDKESFTVDLKRSVAENKAIFLNYSFPRLFNDVKNIIPLISKDSLMIRRNFKKGGFDRIILTSTGKQRKLKFDSQISFKKINHNTISSLPLAICNDSIVLEACISLNEILMYSVDGHSYQRTICVGNHLDDVNKTNNLNKSEFPRAYGGIQQWKDKVVLLYHGISEKNYQSNIGNSELQIFSENMQPLMRIKLPEVINGFYIDKDGELLMLISRKGNQNITKCNISNLLNNLP